MTRRVPFTPFVVAAALLLAAGAAFAQTSCEDALAQAQKSYDLGAFDDVPAQLAPCLDAKVRRRVAVDVHRLLALTYLYNDEPEKARKEVSTLLRLDSTFEAASPALFAALVAQVRREEQVTQVASVSKTSESLREAPATVVVVTGEEIQRRGYLDLEQLLHDLPGFDISRLNGDIYSHIYQRGYRSPINDRLLLLIDGVEQNELSTNTLYLSRQYSLTNVDRVEVIYGPASTMYGANAYTGVISIITREPDTLVGENGRFGMLAQTTYGGYGTRSADVTLAGRNGSGTISWSLAGNFQRSRERDLSNFDEWDYTYRNFDYRSFLRLSGGDAEAFVEIGGCDTPSAYWECVGDVPGQRTIELTSAGESLVRAIDLGLVNENQTGFEEGAQNWSIYGKIRISNLTIGVEAWRSAEQVASAGLAAYLSGRTSWTPEATALYMKYSVPLERVKLNVFTRYEQTGVKRSSSRFDFLHHFISGYYNLFSFIPSCNPAEGADTSCLRTPVYLENVWFGTTSSQLRSEANVVYEPSEKLSGVAGVELAKSSIQTTYDVTAVGIDFDFFQPVEQVGHTDYALYAQGSYKLRPSLKAVLAGRLSHNRVSDKSDAGAYGILFTPRAGLIYSPLGRKLVLKAIYAEAFKDPTDYQRFGTLADVNDYPAEGLKPERVRNLELSAGWEPHRGLSLDASVYEARYSDVIAFGPVDDCGNNDPTDCLQYQNRDELRVRGLQMSGRYRRGPAEVWGHYTFTDPVQQNPRDVDGNPFFDESGRVLDEIPVADIASHHLAAGAEMTWDRWRFGLRAKHVGARRAGPGTTAPGNIHSEFAAHQTADVTFSYDTTPSTRLQVIVQNLFDAQYYDPGVEYKIHSSRVLQAGRAVYLRLILGLR